MVGILVAAALTLTSPAFTNDGNIPSKFTCDAGMQNPSPALEWKDAPAGTKSFALIMPPNVGTARLTSDGCTKIDEPTMVPTTIAVACVSPIERVSLVDTGWNPTRYPIRCRTPCPIPGRTPGPDTVSDPVPDTVSDTVYTVSNRRGASASTRRWR